MKWENGRTAPAKKQKKRDEWMEVDPKILGQRVSGQQLIDSASQSDRSRELHRSSLLNQPIRV
jgi:hypothetical protein